jgi:propionyl-CoA synthetase
MRVAGVAIVDNYWQTESGWPILSAQPASRKRRASSARPSFPVYGYDVKSGRQRDGADVGPGREGRADDSRRRCRPAA